MAVTRHTLNGNFLKLVGDDFAAKDGKVKAFLTTNLPAGQALVDTANNVIQVGTQELDLTDGAFSVSLIATDSADTNIADDSLRYRVTFTYVSPKGYGHNPAAATREVWDSDYFELTADADLSDVAGTIVAPISWRSAFITDMEAIQAAAEAARDDAEAAAAGAVAAAESELQGYVDDAQAAAAQAHDISNIDTPDALVAALVPTSSGSATSTALTASIEAGADERIAAAAGVTVARIKATLRGNRAVFLGDSITVNQGNDTSENKPGVSWPMWACFSSLGNLIRVKNAGVAGDTSAQMLARFDTDVAAYAPSLVTIMAGTNDTKPEPTGLSFAAYQANIAALVAKVRAIGAQPILCTMPPQISTPDRRTRVTAFNAWLRRYAAAQGIPLVDFYAFLIDPATGGIQAAYDLDDTHPTNVAQALMGKFFWDSISDSVPPVPSLLPMENADPNNLLANGLFLTTTGSGATLRPTGWSIQGSAHPSGVTAELVTGDESIKGNWWKVTAANAASNNAEFLTISSGIVPGHVYAHVGRFKATGLRNADSGSGSGVLLSAWFGASDIAKDYRAINQYYDVPEGVYYHEFTAPAGETSVMLRRQLLNVTDGDGTLQVAQIGLYDLTAMGIV